MIESFGYFCDDRIVSACLTYEQLQSSGLRDDETEGLNAITDQAAGVKLGIVVRETEPHQCRISIRADKGFEAIRIARHFGGGGHASAAGAVAEGDPAEIRAELERLCIDYLRKEDLK